MSFGVPLLKLHRCVVLRLRNAAAIFYETDRESKYVSFIHLFYITASLELGAAVVAGSDATENREQPPSLTISTRGKLQLPDSLKFTPLNFGPNRHRGNIRNPHSKSPEIRHSYCVAQIQSDMYIKYAKSTQICQVTSKTTEVTSSCLKRCNVTSIKM